MDMATRSTAAERAEWLEDMRAQLPPGSTVHTVLRHVSRSGMSRAIDLYALTCEPDGTVGRYWLSYRAAAVMGWTFSNRYEALIASGAGMDMGFHAVYSLSSRLYPDGFDCTGERCPSSDHSNGMPRPLITAAEAASMIGKAPVPHHASGGYALRQAWL